MKKHRLEKEEGSSKKNMKQTAPQCHIHIPLMMMDGGKEGEQAREVARLLLIVSTAVSNTVYRLLVLLCIMSGG